VNETQVQVQASQHVANINEAHMECWWPTQERRQVIGYAGENVSDKTQILLIGTPCDVYGHYGELGFKAERGWTAHNFCLLP
jgi:hypothetical protein